RKRAGALLRRSRHKTATGFGKTLKCCFRHVVAVPPKSDVDILDCNVSRLLSSKPSRYRSGNCASHTGGIGNVARRRGRVSLVRFNRVGRSWPVADLLPEQAADQFHRGTRGAAALIKERVELYNIGRSN